MTGGHPTGPQPAPERPGTINNQRSETTPERSNTSASLRINLGLQRSVLAGAILGRSGRNETSRGLLASRGQRDKMGFPAAGALPGRSQGWFRADLATCGPAALDFSGRKITDPFKRSKTRKTHFGQNA
jgi:hypothetical protein